MFLERELKEVFDFYSGGDGGKQTITFLQLAEITDKANLHLSDEALREHIKQMGGSGDKVSYKEFVELFDKKIYNDVPKNDVIQAFKLFDKDNSGKILIDDFKHVMFNLCEDLDKVQIENFLQLADQKKDGYLHIEEFVSFLKS